MALALPGGGTFSCGVLMSDARITESVKRTECVKVCFSEKVMLDLNRRAIREDRTLAELIHLIVLDDEYGKGKGPGRSPQGTAEDRDAP